jgi:hypothetical protein
MLAERRARVGRAEFGFLPMQSRSTPTALTLAHGRLEADRASERDVAQAVVKSDATVEERRSCTPGRTIRNVDARPTLLPYV